MTGKLVNRVILKERARKARKTPMKPKKKKRKWCKHIKWLRTTYGWKEYFLVRGHEPEERVGDDWEWCPVCGAKRPFPAED